MDKTRNYIQQAIAATFPELTQMLLEARQAKGKAIWGSASWQHLERLERALMAVGLCRQMPSSPNRSPGIKVYEL